MNRWATAEAIAAATEAIAAAAEAVGPPPRLLRPPPRLLRWPTRSLQPPPTPLGHHRGRWAAAEAVGPPRRLLRPPPMPFRQAQRPLQRPLRPLWRHSKRWGYHYSFFLQNVPQFCPNSAGNGPEISQKLAFGRARDAQKCLGWAFRLSPRPGPSLIPNTYMEKVTIQYICPFLYSSLYQFLRGLEGSHRLTTQKVSGSKPGWGRKNLFLFFQFFPGLSQNINKTQS